MGLARYVTRRSAACMCTRPMRSRRGGKPSVCSLRGCGRAPGKMRLANATNLALKEAPVANTSRYDGPRPIADNVVEADHA